MDGTSYSLFVLIVEFANGPGDDDRAGDAWKEDRHRLQWTDGQGAPLTEHRVRGPQEAWDHASNHPTADHP